MRVKTKPSRSRRAAPTAARLIEIVDGFRRANVAVLGDLVSDEFVYGDIERISREAPVPILRHRKTAVVPGGGGNAVANLRALGASPVPIGVVGRDVSGRRLLAEFRRRQIPTAGILVRAGYETPSKSRILAGGVHTRRQQLVRIDRGGDPGALPAPILAALSKKMTRVLAQVDGLLVADYGYGAATPDLVAPLARRIRSGALPTFVDSRSRVMEFRGVTACTPNQEELERALSLSPIADDAMLDSAARRLLRRTGNSALLVTRGARGMTLLEGGRTPLHVPAYGSDEVADVTGAGDTVIAVFALALISGADFSEAARLSNYAAGLVVMKMGTATLTPAELKRAIREDLARG